MSESAKKNTNIGKKLTLEQIISIHEGLGLLGDLVLPYDLSYKVSRQIQKLSGPLEAYNKEMKKIREEFTTEHPNDETQKIVIPGRETEFELAVNTLKDKEEEDLKLDNFTLDEFKKVKNIPAKFFILCFKVIKDPK